MVAGAQVRRRSTISGVENDLTRLRMLKIREEHARNQLTDYSHVFRKKTRLDLIRLSAIMFGIEFVHSAETGYISPILLSTGLEHSSMTMIWGISPLLGFILGPLIGCFSDRCRSSWGRRRPIMLVLMFGLLIGLSLAPYGTDIANIFTNQNFEKIITPLDETVTREDLTVFPWHVLLTIMGVVFLDFCVDSLQSPSRAYLLDMCDQKDHTRAMTTFSIMTGAGGCLGAIMAAINWRNTFLSSFGNDNYKIIFALTIVIFVACFIINVTSFREIPLKLLENDELLRPLTEACLKKEKMKQVAIIDEKPPVPVLVEQDEDGDSIIDCSAAVSDFQKEIEEEDNGENSVSLIQYLKSIVVMPKAMWLLCLTAFLTWLCQLSNILYFTDFVGDAVFHGNSSAPPDSEEYLLYEEGVRFGCWGLATYTAVCGVYAYFIERLLVRFKAKILLVSALLLYSVCMSILAAWPTKWGCIVFSLTTGIVFASSYTIPFMLVANYHGKELFHIEREGGNSETPKQQKRGLGTDIAIIGSMLFLAQIVLSLGIGFFIDLFQTVSTVLYASSLFAFLGAIAASFCVYMDL